VGGSPDLELRTTALCFSE